MHLTSTVIALLFITALTFASPIIPTQPALSPSVVATYASKPTTHLSIYPSHTVRPHPTTLRTRTGPIHTHSLYDAEHIHSHSAHSTHHHIFTSPTGTYHPTVYHKPPSTPSVYARDATNALIYRDEVDTDRGCPCGVEVGCSRGGCFEGCKPCHSPDSVSETDAAASLTARHETEVDSSLIYRNAAGAILDLAGRDQTAADEDCNWDCFGTACECFPKNAGGKSVTFSKTLAVLAIFGAAGAAAGFI